MTVVVTDVVLVRSIHARDVYRSFLTTATPKVPKGTPAKPSQRRKTDIVLVVIASLL